VSDYDNYNTNGVITRDVNDFSSMPAFLRIRGNPNNPNKQTVHVERVSLSDEDRETIVEMYKNGWKMVEIADEKQVEVRHIRRIIKGALGDREARKNYRRSHTNERSFDQRECTEVVEEHGPELEQGQRTLLSSNRGVC